MPPDDAQQRVELLEAELATLRRELALAKARYSAEEVTSTGVSLERLVQSVIDIGVEFINAQFGAFFYKSVASDGEHLMLYALSGAPREAFSKFPIPGRTALFGPTFAGARILRIDDVLADPRYGRTPPHYGMPKGHLPVRSYLAAPVKSRSGEVLGGLFFGHPEPAVFNARAERCIEGIAQLAAIALENANLLHAVSDSERRFRALIENLNEGIGVLDAGANIRYVSPSLIALAGYDEEELIGRRVFEHVHPDDTQAFQEFFRYALEHPGETVSGLHRRQHKDGRWLWLEGLAINLLDDPAVRGVVTNFRDVTERKRAAEVQIRSQKMEALGTLAGGIAHDFNNLLLAVAGNAKLAAEDLDPQHPVQRCISEITRASQRATGVVARILAFSRQQEPKKGPVQFQRLVEEVLQLLRATIPATVSIRSTIQPDVIPIHADASQIHQVLINLITNAAYAIGNHVGTIDVMLENVNIGALNGPTVRALKSGRYAYLKVADSGCGMDEATLARIFDPFFTTKPVGEGTGLGLSVAHGIVEAHGGTIAVESQLGRGTTFHVYLPTLDDARVSEAQPQRAEGTGRGEHVLYIDDDEAIVFLTTRILQRLGYRVSAHSEAVEALRAFAAAPSSFDVVVTDLSMPKMSGFDVARALRAIRADIPIFMTSGYVRPEDRANARAQGIVDLIEKPNTVDALGRALDELFRRMRDASPSTSKTN